MRLQTFNKITYRYRQDPVPYCGIFRPRKPKLPYNPCTTLGNFIQEEDYRHFKDPVYKEVVSLYGWGCIHCYQYLRFYERHTDRCWKISYKCRKQWMKHQKKHYPTFKISPCEEFDDSANT